MKRNVAELEKQTFDLLVVGAGVYGSIIAWDAALRGLSVALIDRGDFGGGTSSNSLHVVHGGLRYLQQADVVRMRESIRERRTFMRIAPHLVHPLPCVMPTYRSLKKGKTALAVALFLNDAIGFDRNRLPDPEKILPSGKSLSRGELLSLFPGVRTENLTGGALWFDAQMHNSERLTLSFVHSAVRAGARVANYVRADAPLGKNRVSGVKATDILSGRSISIHAKVVVNAAGPWVNSFLSRIGRPTSLRVPLTKAMNLVLRRPIVSTYALGIGAPNKPVYFFAPWRGLTLAGTKHLPFRGPADSFDISESDIAAFIADLNEAYPAARINRSDVLYALGGMLPGIPGSSSAGEVKLWRHYRIFDHEAHDQLPGLISVVGVKYTTARDVAERTVNLVAQKLKTKLKPCRTAETPVYGGHFERFAEYLSEQIRKHEDRLSPKVIRHLICCYGSEFEHVLAESDRTGMSLQCLWSRSLVIKAEVLHAVREEMAETLSDVVFRRTELGRLGIPGDAALRSCAGTMGEILGWNTDRIEMEIAQTKQEFSHQESASPQRHAAALA